MHVAALRDAFPVCRRLAYLNAGTCGPLPAAALEAAAQVAADAARAGRGAAYFDGLGADRGRLRRAYAGLLGAPPAEVAVTTSTTDGVMRVLTGLDLSAGDEVLTGVGEHPGLLGPLAGIARRRGVSVRSVPLRELPDAVGERTRLIACSHVSWVTGELAPQELSGIGESVPVLLDGAQAVGAIPVDVAALGCAFYCAAGQKWLCGPVGTGILWISPGWLDRLTPIGPALINLTDPERGLAATAHPDARTHDAPALARETLRAALAAHDVLAGFGWAAVSARARALAAALASALAARGYAVAPRGDTTLVSWEDPDPPARAAALAKAGIVVRSIPRTSYVRASVGAWNDEGDLQRLLAALS